MIRSVAVKIKTNAETPPKVRTANKTGRAKPRIFGEFRVSQYTSPATKRPTVELNMGFRWRLSAAFGSAGNPCRRSTPQQEQQERSFRSAGTFEWPLFTSAISSQQIAD
jgi:hypothetical protein